MFAFACLLDQLDQYGTWLSSKVYVTGLLLIYTRPRMRRNGGVVGGLCEPIGLCSLCGGCVWVPTAVQSALCELLFCSPTCWAAHECLGPRPPPPPGPPPAPSPSPPPRPKVKTTPVPALHGCCAEGCGRRTELPCCGECALWYCQHCVYGCWMCLLAPLCASCRTPPRHGWRRPPGANSSPMNSLRMKILKKDSSGDPY